MKITYNKKCLFIGDFKREFTHEIREINLLEDRILVLLLIPENDNKTIDNIYALSYEGEIIWQVESLKKLYPKEINLPYEYMTVDIDKIKAVDFYGRRYYIDTKNGFIKKRDFVK